ncbi:hypothetical protein EVAR_91723_1 [Eumeta japonica]|uniref:Uncharacterized protein n=1 Tax=Eumeta variegata TaxID=151549 RepID=A0A4C1T061_EUMVA|nr:hypothetical protein EVAR_91723_1 [Eumeta japonica]
MPVAYGRTWVLFYPTANFRAYPREGVGTSAVSQPAADARVAGRGQLNAARRRLTVSADRGARRSIFVSFIKCNR